MYYSYCDSSSSQLLPKDTSGLESESVATMELDNHLSLTPGMDASWRSSLCSGRTTGALRSTWSEAQGLAFLVLCH
ncbi:hypothetical protein BDW62DRAFT_196437 [Aspergillus aurantiobrunneus]